MMKLRGEVDTDWHRLFAELVSISYTGDIRMALGIEQKDKINGIVSGQYDRLKDIYSSVANKYGIDKNATSINLSNQHFTELVSSRCRINAPINTHEDLAKHLSNINRKTSIKMAVSQFIAGHPLKNVN